MLTNELLSYYNHLLAATIMYLTMVDPLKDIAQTLSGQMERDHNRLCNVVLAVDSQHEDYYKTLGVNKDATKQEIHRAFRQLAKKYHPDKNKDKSATDEFIKIFKAYETLSDEKKRKEYDQKADSPHSWSSSSYMNDFDINDFFKQYEDQFMRHAQHHDSSHNQNHYQQHHNAHHEQHKQDHFSFHGINLDDLFHDIDDDEFSSFGKWFESSSHNHDNFHQAMDGHFGDGKSFFGSPGFPSHIHDSLHQYQHIQNSYASHHQGAHAYSCQTTTRQVNGVVMTQTNCS